MNREEELEREHEKGLIALEQEIEGWKAANRLLIARIDVLEKAKIYVVIQYLPAYETAIEMVTTDYEKACNCRDEHLEHRSIELWENGAREGLVLD